MIDYKQSSMVDIAFDLMKKKKKPVDFYKLWQEVSEIKGFSEADKDENESLFYTNITLDGRLITVGENMNDIYADEEETPEEEEDDGLVEDDYN